MAKAMGFLDKLWDETLAGPAPERGLGKLRKYKSLSAVRSPNHPIVTTRYHDHDDDYTVPAVTRSITILRSKNFSVPGSPASSPSSSSGPSSPFSPGTKGKDPDVKRFTRKKSTFDPNQNAEATSPSGYDWILLSALDR